MGKHMQKQIDADQKTNLKTKYAVNSYSLNFSEYHKSNINPVKNYQIHSCFPSVVLKNEYINRTKKLRISRIFDLITFFCLFFYRNKCTEE